MQCSLVEIYRLQEEPTLSILRIEEYSERSAITVTQLLARHLPGLLFNPEDGGNIFIQN
jgi:hypothetical protein